MGCVSGLLGGCISAPLSNGDVTFAGTGKGPGKPAASGNAFEIAKAGGKHAGFLTRYLNATKREVEKGIRRLGQQIRNHQSWIENPRDHIREWDALDPRQRDALVNRKWPSDIQRQMEQRDILQGLADSMPDD
jgi:hypothetical protein